MGKITFRDKREERQLKAIWAALERNNPYKGMTTKEILHKIRTEP